MQRSLKKTEAGGPSDREPGSQGWEELMMVVESAMAGGRKEVAIAAIQLITTVTAAHGGGPSLARPMWRRELRAMGVGVEAATSPHCGVPLMARLELVAAIGAVQARSVAQLHHLKHPPCPLFLIVSTESLEVSLSS